jgi:predicted metal-dependent hydrolase
MQKTIYVESIDRNVVFSRRKGTRSIRISIKSDGKILLSAPYMVSEKQAVKFLEQKTDWIEKHHNPQTILDDGMHIGKSNKIVIVRSTKESISTRLKTNEIVVSVPGSENIYSERVQLAIRKACERALKKEAVILLSQRIKTIAESKGIKYGTFKVKKLKSRWGSCDSQQNIVLNIYLIQLDWSLIDYVIYHELSHVRHKHHQKAFWDYLESMLPDYKQRRKILKTMSTDINPT